MNPEEQNLRESLDIQNRLTWWLLTGQWVDAPKKEPTS